MPKAKSPPKKQAMSSVGGGYGKPPAGRETTKQLNQSSHQAKTGKESNEETVVSGVAKAFPMVRQKAGGSVVGGGVKLAG